MHGFNLLCDHKRVILADQYNAFRVGVGTNIHATADTSLCHRARSNHVQSVFEVPLSV